MTNILGFFRRLRKDEKGATAIEYGLLAALIAVGIIGAVSSLKDGLVGTFGDVTAELGAADGDEPEEPVVEE